MKKNQIILFFTPALIVLFLIIGIIKFPNESLTSAKEGLNIWTTVLIPSLLPFIIGANLIVDLKVVDLIGFIINPITKFIFNVSGKSALVFVISTVSGYPVGSKLASELRINKEISKSEAQRLVSFCSTSGPLFIIGAVATGMFKNPSLGYLMILCHYLGSISIGLLFRNYGNEVLPRSSTSVKLDIRNIIERKSSSNNGFFVLFGNAVFNGVNTLLMVGGFVIVFSVIFKVLTLFNVISFIASILFIPLSLFGVTKELCLGLISGLFEMTIGCNNISAITNTPEILRASLCSFLIGFSGLSILAQCCNFLAKSDINTNIYILSKILHGILAGLFTYFLYPMIKTTTPVSNFIDVYNNSMWNYYISNFNKLIPMIIIIYILTALFILEKKSYKIKKES